MKTNILYRFLLPAIVFIIGFNYSLKSLEVQSASKDKLRDHVKFLAGDQLKGRSPGTPEMKLAEEYIENQFRAAGLKMFKDSFKQGLDIVIGKELGDSNIVIVETTIIRPGIPKERSPRVAQPWTVGQDFMPLAYSQNTRVKSEVTFVGFGISAPDLKYDDYEGIDVKGKIVVLLNETPDGEKPDSEFNNYRSLRYKLSNAKSKGAIGVIMVRIQGDSMNVFERLNFENIGSEAGIVAIQAWRQTLSKLFTKEHPLQLLENTIMKNKKPMSMHLPNTEVTLQTDLKDLKAPTHNIVGFVKGTDSKLAEQYVVIGAHYDHLGYGGPTSQYRGKRQMIHNGADDNASGVAGLIELAHYFAANPPSRSLIFIAFTGEETGLVGSRYFTQNSFIGMENIVGMVNLDMIGRLRADELTVFGTATSPSFASVIDSLEPLNKFKLIRASDAYGPSDHASFYSNDKPVMMFFTGLHEDYHKPSDTWNKLNYEGTALVVDFIRQFTQAIADYPAHLEFTAVTTVSNSHQPKRESGYADVWFGIIPDFEESPLGCKIGGASPGSPADKAGLLKNDIITEIEGTSIKNLHDFMYKIREFKAGDVLKVKILRGEEKTEMMYDVTLTAKNK